MNDVFQLIDLTIGLRLSSFDEDMGVDLVEHGSHNNLLGLDTILDVDIEGQGKTDPGTKDGEYNHNENSLRSAAWINVYCLFIFLFT